MSDFHATERFIGGLVVVGVASLFNWNASQGGESGFLGVALIGMMILGGLWALLGLIELVAGPRSASKQSQPGVTSPGSRPTTRQ